MINLSLWRSFYIPVPTYPIGLHIRNIYKEGELTQTLKLAANIGLSHSRHSRNSRFLPLLPIAFTHFHYICLQSLPLCDLCASARDSFSTPSLPTRTLAL